MVDGSSYDSVLNFTNPAKYVMKTHGFYLHFQVCWLSVSKHFVVSQQRKYQPYNREALHNQGVKST